ncbi:MAG: ADP-ribosylglycohydrolase family protein [Oscillospiraceae bacterium]|nr:ADP-ribosylglycohydrolase family protein [Oscillospiraceae bacterium]
MNSKLDAYRGCLLGLAIGDAMGYPVDTKTWNQIQEDYGPYGLMGYDLRNGYAEVSSHTQLAAFSCNGLLLGQTRGQVYGKMAPFVRYVGLAQQEWAAGQRRYDQPGRNHCWVFRVPEMRHRHCTDTRMVETLNRGKLGSLEDPVNRHDTPAAFASSIAAGIFSDPGKLKITESDRLGAECIALTHGHPLAFLPGAMVAHLTGSCLRQPEKPLILLIKEALRALQEQFLREFPREVGQVTALVEQAVSFAEERLTQPVSAMERLKCDTGAEVLAGAIYAALLCEDDFDNAMVIAVNHSGRSAAVSCLTGAILGARMGEDALPEFYMDGLYIADVLRELADDLVSGCPMVRGSGLFDGDWESKYLHGEY